MSSRVWQILVRGFVLSCGGGGGGILAPGGDGLTVTTHVATVVISPSSASVVTGGTTQLTATTLDAQGTAISGKQVSWASDNPAVATTSAGGLVTGVAVGTATITATSEGKLGSATLTVALVGIGLGLNQFSLIPAGTFQMGSNTGEPNEQPVHTITISHAFYMQKTEVTQGQGRAVMGSNPSAFSSCGDFCPVEQVSWNDIQTFIQTLNAGTPGVTHRLPTEAEWEYASRAGTTGNTYGTRDAIAWYSSNSGSQTHPVAGKQANAWGLYDMIGNVWEWVNDWYNAGYYAVSPSTDPPGPATGPDYRVSRGGSWYSIDYFAHSASRSFAVPSVRSSSIGFRLARTP